MKKGRPLMVEGRLKLDQWDDKQTGQKRSGLGVTLEGFQFIDGGNREGGGGGEPAPRRSAAPSASAPSSPAAEPDMPPQDDDVPF